MKIKLLLGALALVGGVLFYVSSGMCVGCNSNSCWDRDDCWSGCVCVKESHDTIKRGKCFPGE